MTQNENRTLLPLLMLGLGVVLVVGFLIWYLNSANRTEITQGNPAGPTAAADIPFPNVKRVQLGDAKAAYDLNQAVFIDTRGEPYFSDGHIPGALSITNDEILDRLNELDPKAWYITYCT